MSSQIDSESISLPQRILQIGWGFQASKVLLTAVEMDVFTELGDQPRTGSHLAAALGLHPRGVADFFDALVSLGLLTRNGSGPDALYGNTEETRRFLDRASPDYIGGILRMASTRLYRFWHDLPEALRTGEPQSEIKNQRQSFFEELYQNPDKLEEFVDAMTGISRHTFNAFAERFDFSGYRSVCDIGGSNASLSVTLAQRWPHLTLTSVDLAPVRPLAEKNVARHDLSDRIQVHAANMLTDAIPPADVITMSLILHDWDLERKQLLIRKAYEALPENGAFVVIENLIDDERRYNTFGLLMSLNMLIEFGGAFDYTFVDFCAWCQAAGFKRFEKMELLGPVSAAVAYKA